MYVLGHRGFSGVYPENTMLSFRNAIELGADGVELDVHLSKDGEAMIIHDEKLVRTTGRDGSVSDYTRSELERINAGKTKNDEFGFTPIPSLEEFLSYMSARKDKFTNIELKTFPVYYPGIEEKVLKLVSDFSLEDNVIYSSFNPLSIFRVRALDSKAKIGLLYEDGPIHNASSIFRLTNVDYFHPAFRDLDDGIVKGFLDGSVQLNVWTVNEEKDIRKCLEWGVMGCITNYPDRALRLRERIQG